MIILTQDRMLVCQDEVQSYDGSKNVMENWRMQIGQIVKANTIVQVIDLGCLKEHYHYHAT